MEGGVIDTGESLYQLGPVVLLDGVRLNRQKKATVVIIENI